MLAKVIAGVCLGWYVAIAVVSTLGCTQVFRFYTRRRRRAAVEQLAEAEIPHVTVIRPVKGLEPALYDCLASTFRQTYPASKLTVCFCVSDRADPSLPVLHRLLADFSSFDVRLYIEDEDAHVQSETFGPNPKIRNMSRAYREAKGDLIWIIDCNVWVAKGVCGRMVDVLGGYGPDRRQTPYKFVHLLPLVIDVTTGGRAPEQGRLLAGEQSTHDAPTSGHSFRIGGGRMEEMFLSSAHAKFYSAINTVLVAPCSVGKSNMFRKSHVDALTTGVPGRLPGIDYFSQNICEDHLIGDLLWKKQVPEETSRTFAKHSIVWGDFAIQPMAGMSVREYVARRVRWLRVRKFTVTLATFVEPGTESFLCSLYGAYAATSLDWVHARVGIPQTWTAFAAVWLVSVACWAAVDWQLYQAMHSMASIEQDEATPTFARPPAPPPRRPFGEWMMAWVGRETLALPIWTWAFWFGTSVTWRGQRFRVGMDMRVHSLDGPRADRTTVAAATAAAAAAKARQE